MSGVTIPRHKHTSTGRGIREEGAVVEPLAAGKVLTAYGDDGTVEVRAARATAPGTWRGGRLVAASPALLPDLKALFEDR